MPGGATCPACAFLLGLSIGKTGIRVILKKTVGISKRNRRRAIAGILDGSRNGFFTAQRVAVIGYVGRELRIPRQWQFIAVGIDGGETVSSTIAVRLLDLFCANSESWTDARTSVRLKPTVIFRQEIDILECTTLFVDSLFRDALLICPMVRDRCKYTGINLKLRMQLRSRDLRRRTAIRLDRTPFLSPLSTIKRLTRGGNDLSIDNVSRFCCGTVSRLNRLRVNNLRSRDRTRRGRHGRTRAIRHNCISPYRSRK
jgi:hypothetical protein